MISSPESKLVMWPTLSFSLVHVQIQSCWEKMEEDEKWAWINIYVRHQRIGVRGNENPRTLLLDVWFVYSQLVVLVRSVKGIDVTASAWNLATPCCLHAKDVICTKALFFFQRRCFFLMFKSPSEESFAYDYLSVQSTSKNERGTIVQ